MNKKMLMKRMAAACVFQIKSLFMADEYEKGFRVLNYHSVTDDLIDREYEQMTTPKAIFEEQMGFLSSNSYNVISCNDVIERLRKKEDLPPKTICITFDDGFKDNLINAAPVLERYGFKATIFLTLDFIEKNDRYLNWQEVSDLSKTDTVSFGGHSFSHRKLYGLPADELKREIGLSKTILEERLKRSVDIFAYPFGCYGSFDENAVDTVKSEGYKAAFTTIAGFNGPGSDLYRARRTRISWADKGPEFNKELKGAYDWYELWQKITKTP